MLGARTDLSGAAKVDTGIVASESVLYLLVSLASLASLVYFVEKEAKLEAEGGQKKNDVSRGRGRPSVVVRILEGLGLGLRLGLQLEVS